MRLQAPDPAISAVSVGHTTLTVSGGYVDVPDAPILSDDATEEEQREAFAARTVLNELAMLGFMAAGGVVAPPRPSPVVTAPSPPPPPTPSPTPTAPAEGS